MNREELRRRRESLGMSQDQLARALGVTRQSVYMWEAGRTAIPALLDLALRALEIDATSATQGNVSVSEGCAT